MSAIVRRLGEMEITSLMIEGGAIGKLGGAGRRHRGQSVSLLRAQNSRRDGIDSVRAGAGFRRMSDAACVKSFTLHRFGEDFAVEGYLRDP